MTQRSSRSGKESPTPSVQRIFSTLTPLLLICLCPPLIFLLWFTHVQLDGSLLKLSRIVRNEGLLHTLQLLWLPRLFGSVLAWKLLGFFVAIELALLRFVPGRLRNGSSIANGRTHRAVDNGLASFAITVGLYLTCTQVLHLFPASILYDHLGDLLGALSWLALLFCILPLRMYSKRNVLQLATCRLGVMSLPLLILSFASKQQELSGLQDSLICAVGIQLLSIAQFFHSEVRTLQMLDGTHRRSVFYLCWGSLVCLPLLYSSSTLYLVSHPITLGLPLSVILCVLGTLSIVTSHLAQAKRQQTDESSGQTRSPDSAPKRLLRSEYYGLARHAHHLPALVTTFLWTVPALFDSALPYVYFALLLVLFCIQPVFGITRNHSESSGPVKRLA